MNFVSHSTLILLLVGGLVSGCASVPPAGSPDNAFATTSGATNRINWPKRYEPGKASFFVHNEVYVDAPPDAVWRVLVQAETWPSWYEGAENVKVAGSNTGVLTSGGSFTWSTMGLDFTSTITEFEPPFRLSWESRKATIQGYHAWLIIPKGRGSRLVTQESQHGFLTLMQKIFVPNKLHDLHEVWLRQIKKRAELAPSPTESLAAEASR